MKRAAWALCGMSFVASVGLGLSGRTGFVGPSAVLAFLLLAALFTADRRLRGFAFTAWVFAAVAASLAYPRVFGTWFGVDLKVLIVPLIQIIMFGMGTTLSLADFTRVLRMPWPVFVGMVLQFSVMPIAGYAIASSFGFEPEIAAGVVLVGACPGGVASNLMAYIAGADVALSVTMTACSTLLSPVMTPFMMKVLAHQYIQVVFLKMMFDICNMIIVPVAAGLIANRILYSKSQRLDGSRFLALFGGVNLCVAVLGMRADVPILGPLQAGLAVGFLMLGVVAWAKLVVQVWLHAPENWMDRALPVVSMAGICYIIGIITARSSADLLSVGPLLIGASVLHNFVGYVLGYWLARIVRLDEKTCRTVAFEVGMQNAGMASGLAMGTLQSAQAALAPAIWGPWMNVSGSVLATWWHRKPLRDEPVAAGLQREHPHGFVSSE